MDDKLKEILDGIEIDFKKIKRIMLTLFVQIGSS